MNKSRIANAVLAGVLALAVVGIGYSAYRQKVQADTIVPGYSTLHLGLKVTIPETDNIRIKMVAYPERGGKRYYFKERDFTFKTPGTNNIEWYIRKIPADRYRVIITSPNGAFSPDSQTVELENDAVSTRLKYDLFLGMPEEISSPVADPSITLPDDTLLDPSSQRSPTATPTTTPTTTSTDREVSVPPVPQLPTL